MPTDVGERSQAFRLGTYAAVRIAPGIAVYIPEKPELDDFPAARAVAVIGAEITFALVINVNWIVAVRNRTRDPPADFPKNLRRVRILGSGGGVNDVT